MIKAKMLQMGAVAAIVIGSFSATAPANAQGYYGRGGYDRGYDRGYERGDYYRGNGYRGGYGYRGDAYSYRGGDNYYRGNYRGNYRCRNDGATGTILGAVAGGLIGNSVAGRRGDRTAGTIIGGAVGAIAGRSIDKSNSRC